MFVLCDNMIKNLSGAVKEISTFCFLLFIFIFTYSVLGMEWFGYLAVCNEVHHQIIRMLIDYGAYKYMSEIQKCFNVLFNVYLAPNQFVSSATKSQRERFTDFFSELWKSYV